MKEIEGLQQEKQNINAEREKIESELNKKAELLAIEQREKESLEAMLKQLEQKLVQGGEVMEEREKEQSKAHREYQMKLKKQKKKERKLLEEKMKAEEEMFSVNRQYKDLQEEVNENRKIIEKFKVKYQAAMHEIKDL